jgi:O-antigen ligase
MSMVGGVMIALLLLSLFTRFSSTYATLFAAAIMGPFVVFIVGGAKSFLWGLLAACLPVTVDITLGHTGHLSGTAGYVISAFDIILVILYLLWVVEMVREKCIYIRFFPKVSIPTILLIGIAGITTAYARVPELSWFELIEVVKIYLCFLYVSNNIRNERDLGLFVIFLIAGLVFEGVIGFAQHRYSEPFWPTSLGGPKWIDNRVAGTWVSFNDFAWYLTFILPLALSLLFSHIRSIYKYVCGIALVLGCGSLMWTNSRGGWISFGMAAIFVLIFTFGKIRGKWALVRTVISMMVITILITPIYPRLSEKLYVRFAGEDKGSAESRITQFEVAYNMIKAHPFTGVGLNNYTEVMKDYDTTPEGLDTITPHAVHNIFLLLAAETGILGISVFLWIVAAILDEGIRWGARQDGFVSYAVVGLAGGIIAFLFHGLVDTASLGNKLFMFMWFFAGIVVAAKQMIPTRSGFST